MDAVLAQPVFLISRFNSFRHHFQLQRFGHFDDMRRHVFIFERIDKRFVDFQDIYVQILQITKTGIAGAKIINIDSMPRLTIAGDNG